MPGETDDCGPMEGLAREKGLAGLDSFTLLPHTLLDPRLATLEHLWPRDIAALVILLGVGELLTANLAVVHLRFLHVCH